MRAPSHDPADLALASGMASKLDRLYGDILNNRQPVSDTAPPSRDYHADSDTVYAAFPTPRGEGR